MSGQQLRQLKNNIPLEFFTWIIYQLSTRQQQTTKSSNIFQLLDKTIKRQCNDFKYNSMFQKTSN